MKKLIIIVSLSLSSLMDANYKEAIDFYKEREQSLVFLGMAIEPDRVQEIKKDAEDIFKNPKVATGLKIAERFRPSVRGEITRNLETDAQLLANPAVSEGISLVLKRYATCLKKQAQKEANHQDYDNSHRYCGMELDQLFSELYILLEEQELKKLSEQVIEDHPQEK